MCSKEHAGSKRMQRQRGDGCNSRLHRGGGAAGACMVLPANRKCSFAF